MIERKTVIERILVFTETGQMSVRLGKRVIADGEIIKSEPHLVTLDPGDDIDKAMEAVNAHLQAMGCGPCNDFQKIKDHAALVPERS